MCYFGDLPFTTSVLHIFIYKYLIGKSFLIYNQFVIDIANVCYLIMEFVLVGNSIFLVIDLAFL